MSSADLTRRRPIEEHLESVESHQSFPVLDENDTADGGRITLQQPSPPESLRPSSPHPLEAHVRQLETYETERPPFYNKSTIAPNLIFSADSLREDARILAKILISFMAYAIRTHGTTNTCQIGLFGRFDMWPDRPVEANSLPTTVLNEKNIIYAKALIHARRDLQDRGLYVRKFVVKEERKKRSVTADWIVDFIPIQRPAQSHGGHNQQYGETRQNTYQPPSANELLRLHREAHGVATRGSPRTTRANSLPVSGSSYAPTQRRPRTGTVGEPAHSLNVRKRETSEANGGFGYNGSNCAVM